MSDINSSLPIFSEIDGLDARVHTKIVDYTDPSGVDKQVAVGDTLLHVKSHGALTGGGFGALQLSETGSVIHKGVYNGTTNTIPSNTGLIGHARAATPGDSDQTIRLTAGNPSADNVAPANVFALDTNGYLHGFDGTNWDRITATAGSLNVNITSPLSVNIAGVYDVGTNPTPDNVGIILNTRAAAPDDTTQTFRPTGGSPTADNVVSANTFGIDTNAFGMVYDGTTWDRLLGFNGRAGVAISDATGTAFSTSNPLPVTISENPGTEVTDYKAALAVASGATDNHDITVTAATTLSITKLVASGSGRARFDLRIETGVGTGVYTTIATFFNSTASPNVEWELTPTVEVAAGVKVRVAAQNRDNQAQDLFSTIQGYEV